MKFNIGDKIIMKRNLEKRICDEVEKKTIVYLKKDYPLEFTILNISGNFIEIQYENGLCIVILYDELIKSFSISNGQTEDRNVEYPAIYSHFKSQLSSYIPNNYIYATMFEAKKIDYVDKYEKLIIIWHTEKECEITLFLSNGQWYHIMEDEDDDLVIYTSLYDDHIPYGRPKKLFLSKVDKEKYPWSDQEYRFEKL